MNHPQMSEMLNLIPDFPKHQQQNISLNQNPFGSNSVLQSLKESLVPQVWFPGAWANNENKEMNNLM